MIPVQACLQEAHMDKSEVDRVVLIGGSTRIPKVQEMLTDFFDGMKPCQSINPDEAVAYGAALMATMLTGEGSSEVQDMLLTDVTPLSLGIKTSKKFHDKLEDGCMCTVIPRNSEIPVKNWTKVTTTKDDETWTQIEVYEGENPKVKDNNFLGLITLDGLEPAPRGVPRIEVTFDVDSNGILKVSARNMFTDRQEELTITNQNGRLSPGEIDRMAAEAETFKAGNEAGETRSTSSSTRSTSTRSTSMMSNSSRR